ncbi:hypothetical protein [Granulicella tundricola]|uniref:ATPase n=1 Tax=Granulicella tundricola (strain ATCC BAA-1859 / DSM 23138 / MP5ACTX9) TaxID=1198114 RepID=E8X0S8_GRATM|nr:hypothetical protein [Granulicella tundricola]ADW70112.1 ATPase [Granulicella tundricola MP5ACTX9]
MAFVNDTEFQDDFRKVGQDVTAGFERPGAPADPTDHASSENLDVAPKTDDLDEDDDLEDDDLDEDDEDEDDEDLEDDDLEDEDDEEDEDDFEDDEDEDDEEEDEDNDELEEDDDTVKTRAGDAVKVARRQ